MVYVVFCLIMIIGCILLMSYMFYKEKQMKRMLEEQTELFKNLCNRQCKDIQDIVREYMYHYFVLTEDERKEIKENHKLYVLSGLSYINKLYR